VFDLEVFDHFTYLVYKSRLLKKPSAENKSQYPAEFVPYILCWTSGALSSVVAHEVKTSTAPTIKMIKNLRWGKPDQRLPLVNCGLTFRSGSALSARTSSILAAGGYFFGQGI
jgi:hypothetical protein